MQPAWQKYYNVLVVLASRGIGSVIITSLFLIKKYFLPADEFGSLGHAFATVMVAVSPFASPVIMLISRRIIQTRDLGRDKNIIMGWCILSFLGAAFVSIMSMISPRGISDFVFMVSIVAFILVTVLNAQYIIWLNESDQTKRSLIYIAIFIIAIPLSVLVREVSGIGQRDRSFSVETVLLSLPVLIDIVRIKAKGHFHMADLYDFSASNYFKYFAIVLFYNGIIWVDWSLGRYLLPEPVYLGWANDRILVERILLPILNIGQVTMLWHLLRSSTGPGSGTGAAISSKHVKIFYAAIALTTVASLLFGIVFEGSLSGMLVPFVMGYLTFGLSSIFLDFYQAKFSLRYISATLIGITVLRIALSWLAIRYGGIFGYSMVWATTSALILYFIFRRSYDQVRFTKE
jgi:hypothetical protein